MAFCVTKVRVRLGEREMDEDGKRMVCLAEGGDPYARGICVGAGVIQPKQPLSSDYGGAIYRTLKGGAEQQHTQPQHTQPEQQF